MRGLRRTVVVALALATSATAGAQSASTGARPAALRMSRIFNHGMVLQRDEPIRIWGWAVPGSAVLARLGDGSPVTTAATASGTWTLRLPRHRAGGPFSLLVRSRADSLLFTDVLVGDVWVASGQSNMEFRVEQAANGPTAAASADDSTIREFKIPNSWSDSLESDLAGGSWSPAD
ncbi:MAG TPA: hypothetical protein VH277_14775, partial [Gemmatimonadaceae bacterium]|nr:hypothetical protein [Gemmatimonadaceae bacterium]